MVGRTSLAIAQAVANALPGQFDIIVCRSDESEPPAIPTNVRGTMIVQVGHKGQSVGV